jgi:type IV pilus assembly protein PilM
VLNLPREVADEGPVVATLRTSGRSVVGLDIEPGYVTAVEAKAAGGSLVVERAASAPLEPGVVRDGEVADVEALAGALRGMFRAHKLPKRVRVGVANQRIVVRPVDLPPLEDPKELAAAVRFQAQDHIPMPLDQAVLEHVALGVADTAEGKRMRVVLVAARRDMIERLLAAVRAAGLRTEGVDLSAFAMLRALGGGAEGAPATLYVAVGGVTNLALAEGGRCLFNRVVPGGTELLAQELAERRALTLEHAHGWLTHVGLALPVESLAGEPEIVAEARSVLSDGVRRIGDEIRTSLDFYRSQAGAVAVERAVLTGPAVGLPGFREALAAEIGLEVTPGVVAVREDSAPGIDPGRLVVPAGLSVEAAAA